MKKDRGNELLDYCYKNAEPPILKKQADKDLFERLQKSNLIILDHDGKLKVTDEGEKARSMGVRKYLRIEEFEKELAQKAPHLKKELRAIWIGFILVLIMLALFLFTNLEDVLENDNFMS